MVPATCASASVTESSATSGGVEQGGAGEIMLFGVRVVVDSMRKSVSLNNLSQYEQPQESGNNNNNNNNNNSTKEDAVAGGYASADDAVPHSTGTRERKRGVPWTEEEHKLFLIGLKKVGKGDWRGISRNFVKTRTPTQVASHAQKYFLRRSNLNRRRRRSSLFDITTDTVTAIPMEEEANPQENTTQSHTLLQPAPETNNISGFSVIPAFPMTVNPVVFPVSIENPMENLSLCQGNQLNNEGKRPVRPVPVFPTQQAPTVSEISLNSKAMMDPSPLSLKLSLTSDQRDSPSRHSAFQVMPSFNNGDRNSIMGVA